MVVNQSTSQFTERDAGRWPQDASKRRDNSCPYHRCKATMNSRPTPCIINTRYGHECYLQAQSSEQDVPSDDSCPRSNTRCTVDPSRPFSCGRCTQHRVLCSSAVCSRRAYLLTWTLQIPSPRKMLPSELHRRNWYRNRASGRVTPSRGDSSRSHVATKINNASPCSYDIFSLKGVG